MERIDKVRLQGKTTEEALQAIEKWINDTADRANYAMTHLDETNFIDGKQPVMKEDVAQMLDAQWEQVKKLVARNKGE